MKKIIVLLILSISLVCIADNKPPFADKVLVKKSERIMFLLKNGKAFREYSIGLGDEPKGHKHQEGDERTPEGLYTIDYRNPKSRYFLSLHINYPNKKDKEYATRKNIDPGGDIFIHGKHNSTKVLGYVFPGTDWTDGCIAVTNEEIEEIWKLVKNGTPIEILP